MDKPYHIQITTAALPATIPADALQIILAANLGQDALRNQLGSKAHYHYDNNASEASIAAGDAYVAELHQQVQAASARAENLTAACTAFGQLSHAVQDFYAHSNYVDLWLEKHGGLEKTRREDIVPLDPDILQHPALHTGHFRMFPDILYYIPGIKGIFRKLYLPADSHEAMNLDNPAKGERFWYAMHAATERTRREYERARAACPSLAF